MNAINLADAFSRFSEHWSPRIIGRVNDAEVKLAKFKGPFVWHMHEHEDELFLVVKGQFTMRFRDRDVVLRQGDLLIVPRNTEHMPVADDEVEVLLVEPVGTLNTGNIRNERTVDSPKAL